MSYADFSVESIVSEFGLRVGTAELFPALEPLPVPDWLRDFLERGAQLYPHNAKGRSEFIVAPVLQACQEQAPGPVSIYSGMPLDVAPNLGLFGDCDFILGATEPIPAMRAPLVTVVDATQPVIKAGIGPCVAWMVGRPDLQRSGRLANRGNLRMRHRRRGLAIPPPRRRPGRDRQSAASHR